MSYQMSYPPLDDGDQGKSDLTPEEQEIADYYEQQLFSAPYSQGARAFYGSVWVIWTAVLLLFTVVGFAIATPIPAMVAGGLAYLAGRYAYRIWTWQAKRLFFLIVF